MSRIAAIALAILLAACAAPPAPTPSAAPATPNPSGRWTVKKTCADLVSFCLRYARVAP